MNRRFLGGGHPRKKKSYLQMLDKVWEFCFCHCSVAQSCPTLCNLMDCSAPGFPILHHLLELAQTHVFESVMPANHPILCRPLLLLPSIFPSIRVFSNELGLCVRWPKYWNFCFNISASNEYSGLISFRVAGLISLQSKGLSRVFSNTTVQKHLKVHGVGTL